jgi:hypothetical protein
MRSVLAIALALALGCPTSAAAQGRGKGPRGAAPRGGPASPGRQGGPRDAGPRRPQNPSRFVAAFPPPFIGRPHHPILFKTWWFGPVFFDPFAVWGPWSSDGLPVSGLEAEGQPTGALQLDVEPRRAQVYVDGQHVGQVEQFSGYFQHLELPVGQHIIELFEPGYDPLTTIVVITPARTVTYRQTMSYASSGR